MLSKIAELNEDETVVLKAGQLEIKTNLVFFCPLTSCMYFFQREEKCVRYTYFFDWAFQGAEVILDADFPSTYVFEQMEILINE